jgi:hypothetical protein
MQGHLMTYIREAERERTFAKQVENGHGAVKAMQLVGSA